MAAGRRIGLLPAAVAVLALTAMPATADGIDPSTLLGTQQSDEQTEVTSLSATAIGGRKVQMSGAATFGGEAPVLVGEDPVGDNTGGQPTGAVGLDIQALYLSRPDPASGNLRFVIDLVELTGGGLPDTVQYNWDIAVDGGAQAGGSNWSIKSSRTSQYYQPGSLLPYAGIHSCVQTPAGWECTERARAAVVYDEAAADIRITVPSSVIGAGPGSRIEAWPRNGPPVWVRPSALGAVTAGVLSFDEATHAEYRVAQPTVRLGIAPAGTPEGNVAFPVTASLDASGSFSGTVTAASTGSHDAWAKACFGMTCATRSVRLTVT